MIMLEITSAKRDQNMRRFSAVSAAGMGGSVCISYNKSTRADGGAGGNGGKP